MLLILAALTFVGTIACILLIIFADGMSDSSTSSISPWPILVGGATITAVLIITHYVGI